MTSTPYVIIARGVPLGLNERHMHMTMDGWLQRDMNFETWMPEVKPGFNKTRAYYTFASRNSAMKAYAVLMSQPRWIDDYPILFFEPEPRRTAKPIQKPKKAVKAVTPAEPEPVAASVVPSPAPLLAKPVLVAPKPVYKQPAPALECILPFTASGHVFWEQFWANKASLVLEFNKHNIRIDNDYTPVIKLCGDHLEKFPVSLLQTLFLSDLVLQTFDVCHNLPSTFGAELINLCKLLPVAFNYDDNAVHIFGFQKDVVNAAVCCIQGIFLEC